LLAPVAAIGLMSNAGFTQSYIPMSPPSAARIAAATQRARRPARHPAQAVMGDDTARSMPVPGRCRSWRARGVTLRLVPLALARGFASLGAKL
jgi:hypothetical protein